MPDDQHDLAGLAAELRALAAHLDVGEPADQRAAVRARLSAPAPARAHRWLPARPGRSRPDWALPGMPGRRWLRDGAWRRRWVPAALAALIAVVAGVAPARAAVVDAVGGLLRIAGIEVRRDSPRGLPARPSPLPSVRAGTLGDARRAALFPVRVPAGLGPPERVELGDPDPAGAPRVVTLLYRGGAVRLDQFDGSLQPSFFKTAPQAQWTEVGTDQAVWLPAPHAVSYVGRDRVERTGTARLAGPTLIWSAGAVSYRLEGVAELGEARAIAASLE